MTIQLPTDSSVVLTCHEKVGETIAASRTISFGTVVATDTPLFVWEKSNDKQQYIRNICHSFANHCVSQLDVLRCFAPDELVDEKMSELDHISPLDKAPNKSDLARVLAVCQINSYGVDQRHCAIYKLGAKVTHSCSPNVVYHFDKDSHQLVIIAQRDIEEGEIICSSYIPDAIRFQSSVNRTQYILPRRLYECACERCHAPDLSRVLRCIKCKTGKVIRYPSTCSWKCNQCVGVEWRDDEMMLRREQMLEEMVFENQKSLETQDVDLDSFAISALSVLDEQHWVMGLTRQMQFEKSLYIGMYAESPGLIQFDKLQLYLNYLEKSTVGTSIFLDQMVSWCIHLVDMKLTALGGEMLKRLAKRVYPQWRAYFGRNDKQVIQLSQAACVCTECGEAGPETVLKRCSRCKSIEYCSVDCQRKNWSHHKTQCQ